jgi:hypothetical protein
VLAVIAVIAVTALLIGLAAFAIEKMKPDKLRIYGESKLAQFGLEITRSEKAETRQGSRKNWKPKATARDHLFSSTACCTLQETCAIPSCASAIDPGPECAESVLLRGIVKLGWELFLRLSHIAG